MTYYDELGVTATATVDEIKRAYREKARQTHPDKGGDDVAFAAVAHAYEVLSDSDRRLLYDATGRDRRTPIEVEVQQILLTAFNQALSGEQDIEVTAFVREHLNGVQQQIPGEVERLKARQKKLEAKRSKIKSKAEVNLVHMIIDGELNAIKGGLAHLEHQSVLMNACLKTLQKYSEDWTEPESAQTFYVFAQSPITSGGW